MFSNRKGYVFLSIFLFWQLCGWGCGPGITPEEQLISIEKQERQLWEKGQFQEVLKLSQKALEISKKLYGLESDETIDHMHQLGMFYQALGFYGQALNLAQEALAVSEKAAKKNNFRTGYCLIELSNVYEAMGFYDLALPLAQKALKIKMTEKEFLSKEYFEYSLFAHNNLAIVYRNMGNYALALPIIDKVVRGTIRHYGPNHVMTQDAYINLADLYFLMGSFDDALLYYESAIKIAKGHAKADNSDIRLIYVRLAHLYLKQRNYPKALYYFDQSKSKSGLVFFNLATGQYDAALKILNSLPARLSASPQVSFQIYTQKGSALAGIGKRREAAAQFYQAIEAVEELRRKVPTSLHTGFFQGGPAGGYSQAYAGLVTVLAEISGKNEPVPPGLEKYGPTPAGAAFYFAEACKGRTLLEAMAAAARRAPTPGLPPDLAKREREILDRMGALEALWEKHYQMQKDALAELKKQRQALQGEMDHLVAGLRKDYPRYAALKYPQPLKPGEIPLKQGEVLLEYALGDKESFLFRVEPGGRTQVFRLALGQEALEKRLAPLLAPFRQDKLTRGDLTHFSPAEAAGLYQELLAPALQGVAPGTHLILVPDGVLGAFPLEALVVQAGTGWGDSVLVADRWPITYSQSAAIMTLNRLLGPSHAGQPLFALGDCLYDRDSARYLAFKAGKEKAGALVAAAPEKPFTMAATRVDWGQLYFPPLPQTRETVGELAALFNQPLQPPQVLLDVLATETRVKKTPLDRYRYLFFGTHGDLTDKTQGLLQPVLILTQVENQPPDDGNLTFTEVLNLKLDAELVTLAACMTGVGQMMQGEGVLNFARAFQQAGARSVMVALWNIPVKESLQFYRTFYQGLKDGKSKLTALKEARQRVRAKEPHPYFWAGLILHGEG